GGFDDLFNETYTARMEEELDDIEEGKTKWTKALSEFYDKFQRDLTTFTAYTKKIKLEEKPTDEICLKCGADGMVKKWGRFGPYLKCLNCDATRDAEPPASGDGTGASTEAAATNGENGEPEPCELCGNTMQMKRGRFGAFPGCSNYAKCKYIKQETTGVTCPRPGCKGELVVKKSKRGKAFYGCSNYPNCNVVYWDKPVVETCPQCNAPFLLETTTDRKSN